MTIKENYYLKKFAEASIYDDPDKYQRRGLWGGMGLGALGGLGLGLLDKASPASTGASAVLGAILAGGLGRLAGRGIDDLRKATGMNLKKIPTVDDKNNKISLDPNKSIDIDPKSIPQLIEALKKDGYIS